MKMYFNLFMRSNEHLRGLWQTAVMPGKSGDTLLRKGEQDGIIYCKYSVLPKEIIQFKGETKHCCPIQCVLSMCPVFCAPYLAGPLPYPAHSVWRFLLFYIANVAVKVVVLCKHRCKTCHQHGKQCQCSTVADAVLLSVGGILTLSSPFGGYAFRQDLVKYLPPSHSLILCIWEA